MPQFACHACIASATTAGEGRHRPQQNTNIALCAACDMDLRADMYLGIVERPFAGVLHAGFASMATSYSTVMMYFGSASDGPATVCYDLYELSSVCHGESAGRYSVRCRAISHASRSDELSGSRGSSWNRTLCRTHRVGCTSSRVESGTPLHLGARCRDRLTTNICSKLASDDKRG